jgi:hypothetical protein
VIVGTVVMSAVVRSVLGVRTIPIRTRTGGPPMDIDIATAPALRVRTARPVARSRGNLRVLDVRDDLSRVTSADGSIVGYVDRVDLADGQAYRARRYIAAERRFVELPTVWSADDAVDCLRW